MENANPMRTRTVKVIEVEQKKGEVKRYLIGDINPPVGEDARVLRCCSLEEYIRAALENEQTP